jgi:choline dehydrogenase-like flavoprotein
MVATSFRDRQLWVAQASVMPDVIRANTKATTMMMVERVPISSAQGHKT